MITTILGIISPLFSYVLNLFVKDAAKKEALKKLWEAKLKIIQAGSQDSINMGTEYDRQVNEQDAPKRVEQPKP